MKQQRTQQTFQVFLKLVTFIKFLIVLLEKKSLCSLTLKILYFKKIFKDHGNIAPPTNILISISRFFYLPRISVNYNQ